MTVRQTLQDLIPNTPYVLRVRALNDTGTSEWSIALPFTTITDTSNPTVPANVTWVVTSDSFHGEWDAVTQNLNGLPILVTRYDVQLVAGATTKVVTVTPGGTGSKITFDLSFAENIALFGTAQPAITMSVRAAESHGLVGAYSTGILATNPVPANVSGFAGVAGLNSVDLTWTANTDADLDHYEVFVGTSSGFTPTTGNRIFSGNITHFFYQSTTYSAQYFKIRAIDKFGQASAVDSQIGPFTPTSPFGADTTAPATPTGLAATITTSTSASLATSAAVSWTANGEADLAGYFLRYRQNGTTPWNTVRYDKATTSAVVSNLVPYVNYDFQLAAVDWSENMSAYTATATGTGATNAAPSTPTAPTVSTNTMQAQVTIPGTKAAGGAMEADVIYYEVYGSSTTGFTPGTTNMLGVVSVGPAMIETFQIPTQGGATTETWYFKIIAVDNGGLKSSASAQTSGTPGLINTANIVNLAVTNAKINDLAVDKLTAGSGLATSFTVKSTLTIGDASTSGAIQSFDYSAGTAGYKIASVGGVASLEVNSGVIQAAALRIQSGANIMPPQYADFQSQISFYSTTSPVTLTATNVNAVATASQAFFNTQSLSYSPTNTTNSVFLGATNTDYNIVVAPSTSYIISYYAMISTGGTAATVTPSLKYSTASTPGTLAGTASAIAANSTWARYTSVVSVPGTATGGAILSFSTNTSTGTVFIDGIQIEEKMSGLTTASTWKPPGATTIIGDSIRTGSITSNAVAQVTQLTPVRDPVSGSILYYGNPTQVNDVNNRPAWQINTTGAATLSNLNVLGNVVVGDPTTVNATQGVGILFNSTSGSPTIQGFPGAFFPDDVGLSFTGPNIPGGATVITYTDSQTVVLSANATATASAQAGTINRPIQYRSQMASANYIPGSQGWMMRSDGSAEFLNLSADSISGASIIAGSLSADALDAGTISADIALAGSFSTTSSYTAIDLNTTNGSATVTTTSGQFNQEDVGSLIVAVGIPTGATIITWNSATSVVISANATATATNVDGQVRRGRQVIIDSTGVNLIGTSGSPVITLPTDNASSALFTGSINANSITIQDYFQMNGTHNALGSGSQLNLSSGQYIPALPPNVGYLYTQFGVQQGDGSHYTPSSDHFNTNPCGVHYDPTTDIFYQPGFFFGGNVYRYTSPTAIVPYALGTSIFVGNSFGSTTDDQITDMSTDASNFYFLTRRRSNNAWRLQGITRTGMARANGPVAGDRVIYTGYDPTAYGSGQISANAGIGVAVYGGNTYIAKINSAGKINLAKFTGLSTSTLAFNSTKADLVSGEVRSLQVGKFDMGGTNVYAVVTISGPSGGRSNYVYLVNTSSFDATNFSFPVFYDKVPLGTAYYGASTDSSGGNFVTLSGDGYFGTYTGLAKTTAGTTLKASMGWRNNGAGGGTAALSNEGPVGSASLRRRSIIIITSPSSIPDTGGDSPNSVAYKVGVDSGTRWRYPDPATGVSLLTISTLQTSNSGSLTPAGSTLGTPSSPLMTAGTASLITAGSTSGVDLTTISGTGQIVAPAFVKVGTGTVPITVSNTDTSVTVTFANAFPASGPVPTIMVTPNVSSMSGVSIGVTSISRGSFVVNARRTAASSLAFSWLAIAQ